MVSRLPGRIRIRHRSLRTAWCYEKLAEQLRNLHGMGSVTGNLAAGSILLRYDPDVTDIDAIEPAVCNLVNAAFGTTRPFDQEEIVEHERLSLKDWNRPIKIGMTASLAASLLALYSSKRLHAAVGFLYLALLLLHMATHRRTLFR
jgi:copper chaperone CopZ